MQVETKVDVLAVMANPAGFRFGGRWGTGEVAQWMRLSGTKVATSRVLTALRREQRAGNVECLGPLADRPGWHGHNITANAELQWRLSDDYAIAHGNEACRAAHARVSGGGK